MLSSSATLVPFSRAVSSQLQGFCLLSTMIAEVEDLRYRTVVFGIELWTQLSPRVRTRIENLAFQSDAPSTLKTTCYIASEAC